MLFSKSSPSQFQVSREKKKKINMGKTGFITVMIMSVIATMMVQSAIGQTVHVVGDSLGWTVTGNDDVYDNWADTRVFRVGDVLTFNFTTGEHDVVEVTEASYDACTSTNKIGSIITAGPANITLTTVGEHNYICTFANGRHCQNGQKLDITVLAAAPGTIASPPPPATTTPPPTIASPPPPPTTTAPPTIAPPPPSIRQTVHVVGGSLGWIVTGNDDVYENWADTRIFRVGDILTFNFTTGEHDVVEVTEASYDACSSTNTIGSIITTGPANITLTTAGEHNYICTFAGGRHCQNGQKLDINVLAAAPGTIAPPPPPTTTAPPPSINGPTTSPNVAPSPPPSTNGPIVSPTTAPQPSSTYEPAASPSTSPPPPSTNGPTTSPTTTSPPPDGSASSVVLGGVFVTFVSIVFGLFM